MKLYDFRPSELKPVEVFLSAEDVPKVWGGWYVVRELRNGLMRKHWYQYLSQAVMGCLSPFWKIKKV